MGEKSATSPEAIHSRIAKRDSKPYGLAIGEWWRDNPKRSSHLRIKYPQLIPDPINVDVTPGQGDGSHSSSQNARKSNQWDVHLMIDMDD